MFLKRLKEREFASPETTCTEDEEFTTTDGHNKGSAVFPPNLEEVTQSMELFKSNFEGISLALGVIGFVDLQVHKCKLKGVLGWPGHTR